jgi:hypothetical protein
MKWGALLILAGSLFKKNKEHLQYLQKTKKNPPSLKLAPIPAFVPQRNMPPKKKLGTPDAGSGDIRAFCTAPKVLRNITNTVATVAIPTPAARKAFPATRNLKLDQMQEAELRGHEEDVMHSGDRCELRMHACMAVHACELVFY